MKKFIQILLFLLTLACMCGIFMFSAQTGEQSNELSNTVTQKIAEKSIISDATNVSVNSHFHTLVRKYAHFTIFFALGLFSSLFGILTYKKVKIKLLYPTLLCLLWAISDEIHQLYIPGRTCRIKDVLIDFSGSMLAIVCIFALWIAYKKIHSGKIKKSVL